MGERSSASSTRGAGIVVVDVGSVEESYLLNIHQKSVYFHYMYPRVQVFSCRVFVRATSVDFTNPKHSALFPIFQAYMYNFVLSTSVVFVGGTGHCPRTIPPPSSRPVRHNVWHICGTAAYMIDTTTKYTALCHHPPSFRVCQIAGTLLCTLLCCGGRTKL